MSSSRRSPAANVAALVANAPVEKSVVAVGLVTVKVADPSVVGALLGRSPTMVEAPEPEIDAVAVLEIGALTAWMPSNTASEGAAPATGLPSAVVPVGAVQV